MIPDRFEIIDNLNKELEHLYRVWDKANSNLDNPKFMEKAPTDVKEKECQKWTDSLNAIIAIENQIWILLPK